MDMDTLHKARQARNWIAHEGASIGSTWSVNRARILQHALKPRTAMTDLALGDNIISQWCHGLAEPRTPPPRDWINGYPDVVVAWSSAISMACCRADFEPRQLGVTAQPLWSVVFALGQVLHKRSSHSVLERALDASRAS
ncbi:hypothetical protein [Streptomyces vietnamensis]|uniref:Uncharacterized protein n=1 Tax=Streptomyces vietnamensis TaxID=362257 RepID=A0A0B5IHG8_9ACTN|nr:hypothetical protein [Streptomyces vietnamensis]AJF69118.1 hypothetical protein SVTN_37315 [Streptomyces vietnamensis]